MPLSDSIILFSVPPAFAAQFPVASFFCRFIYPANQNLNPQSWKTSCRTGPGLYWLCGIAETGRHSSGTVGFVNIQGGFQMFVVRDDGKQSLVGSAKNRRLYDKFCAISLQKQAIFGEMWQ